MIETSEEIVIEKEVEMTVGEVEMIKDEMVEEVREIEIEIEAEETEEAMIEMKKEVKEMIKIIVTEKGKSLSPLYFLIDLESVILFRTFSYRFFNVYRYFLFIWR